MRKIQVGDSVTVKKPIAAMYSGYTGNPTITLTPDIRGRVAVVNVPAVRDLGQGKFYHCVDFYCAATGRIERASVYPNNLTLSHVPQ